MRFNRVFLKILLAGVLALSTTAISPWKGLPVTITSPAPSQATTYVHDGIYRHLASVYSLRHKQVDDVQVVRWCDSDHVIFTFTLDQKPSYGLASISEPANDGKSVHVEVTAPLFHDPKLTCIMGWNEHRTRLLGVVNDRSIVQIRVKLGWVTLYQQPVDNRFYLIEMPYALKGMLDYQYMYVQGVDNKGRVVADTKQTNLKYDNPFLRSTAILHGLLARAHH